MECLNLRGRCRQIAELGLLLDSFAASVIRGQEQAAKSSRRCLFHGFHCLLLGLRLDMRVAHSHVRAQVADN